MNTHQSNPNHDAWEPCPRGTLSGVVNAVRARRRKQTIGRIAASTVAVVLVFVGTTVLVNGLSGPRETDFGGIRCGEVQKLAHDYLSGELKDRDPQLAQRIADHVVKCPRCVLMFDQMREEAGMPPVAFRHGACPGCDDPHCPHHNPRGENPLVYLAQGDDAHPPLQVASR